MFVVETCAIYYALNVKLTALDIEKILTDS